MQIFKSLFPLSFLMLVASVFLVTGCGGRAASTSNNVNPAPIGSSSIPPSSSSSPPAPPAPSPTPTPTPIPGPAAPQNATVNTKIEAMPGWQWCTAQTADRRTCASGLGNAVSSKTDNQANPSRDGSSSKFYIGGPQGYSNALWWKTLSPDDSFTHFQYDLWFYVDNGDVPQALEFDVNQTLGGTRYIWGTECNFKGTGKWDVWDSRAATWVPSQVGCTPFSANSWHHLVWQFERVNGQVHYIALTVDGQTMNVDIYKDPQANVGGNEISVAFQLDGDIGQDQYNVWLDQVTLSEW